MNFLQKLNNLFKYKEKKDYEFILPNNSNNLPEENKSEKTKIFNVLEVNLEYLKNKYNLLINSDIKTRNFSIPINKKKISACLFYIDGMVNEQNITNSILQPLMLKNSIYMADETNISSGRIRVKNNNSKISNLESFIYNNLITNNSISEENYFENVIKKINSGFCVLLIDTINIAFCIEAKDIKGRTVTNPITENIIRGPQEAFVENIRINTSMIRKIINNENLTIEEIEVR